ncbi:hypothetical protein [Nitriliruptor alkaliphilus]|uniref:hypothetical protein n=1 Tax=Nitriliruptor alkaliphilus TaxID=427918 RepID=UPI000697A36F|nr:hypothetical protein [Nitriliruptor alkaliphilus]
MSSMTQLLQGDTALRGWFEAEFPQAADRLQPDPPPRRVVPMRRPWQVPPWLIGMAFDWRLRLGLEAPRVEGSTAEAGWWHLEAVTSSRQGFAEGGGYFGPSPSPVHRLVEVATQARGGHGQPRDEEPLARAALSLAAYETCYRQGVAPDDPLVDVRSDTAVDRMLAGWEASAVDDLLRLMAAARGGLRELFPAAVMDLNPTFGGRETVGADGDLIVDGCLIDLKTVSRPEIKREWVWQQVGYLLLDGGRRQIGQVGFYLSRHARLLLWPVPEFVAVAADRPVLLDELADGFAAALARDLPTRGC